MPNQRSLDLWRIGPLVEVSARALRSDEPDEVEVVAGKALIDTGASWTCIDASIAEQLGCTPVDSASMMSASHESVRTTVYAARLDVPILSSSITARRAFGANLSPQGLVALIGRDILRFWHLTYDGPAGTVVIGTSRGETLLPILR